MPAVVIVGAQWGDEGKGKVVDLLSERADVVVRYAGGPNAGHTLMLGQDRVVLRLVPSGVLHPHTECLLGQGMVLNLGTLGVEIAVLEGRGITPRGRLWVSDGAHLILPQHVLVDELREGASAGTKIGTTKRGIGPCYEDKVGRRGLRVGDLGDGARVRAIVGESLAFWEPVAAALGGTMPRSESICEELERQAGPLSALFGDTGARLEEAISARRRVMLEGAQGTMLDVDHGTYPFVTSSSAVAGGACTGAGIGPTRIDHVQGISKAYATRVGSGTFPTELTDERGEALREAGQEFGSVTGRPRRTGWLDLPALRYAKRVNGLDGLSVTKLDVLSGLERIEVCVAYETARGRQDVLPAAHLAQARPIYESLPGWRSDLGRCRELSELPRAVRAYLRFLEDQTGLPLDLVSVGPRRDETILLRDPFDGGAAG